MTVPHFSRWALAAAVGFVALLAIGGIIFVCSPSVGPTIQGRRLVEWLQRLDQDGEMQNSGDAANVIQSLNPAQLGSLVDLLETESGPDIGHRLNSLLEPIGARLGLGDGLKLFSEREYRSYCDLALGGFRVLGTNAAPVVPRLTREVTQWTTSLPAASALSSVGGSALLPLVVALTNGSTPILPYRWPLAYALRYAPTSDAEVVVPALVRALGDTEVELRIYASESLRKFRGHGREFFPAMLANLRDPNSRVRACTVETLGVLEVKQAVPMLKSMVTDPDVRVMVKVALHRLQR